MGLYLRHGMEQRVRELERLKIMLEVLCSQLEYSQAPVCSLLETLCLRSELARLGFLDECRRNFEKGIPFPSAWKTGVMNASGMTHLKNEDTEILLPLGEIIGAANAESQINSLKLHLSLLNVNLETAGEENKKYGMACSTLGILAGIAAGIVLI